MEDRAALLKGTHAVPLDPRVRDKLPEDGPCLHVGHIGNAGQAVASDAHVARRPMDADVVATRNEDTEWTVRKNAIKMLQKLQPATLASTCMRDRFHLGQVFILTY